MLALEIGAVGSLHQHPTDEDRFKDSLLSFPEVNSSVFGLANVECKIVVLTPLNLIINLRPELRHNVTRYLSRNSGINR